MNPIAIARDKAGIETLGESPFIRWALASLALSMLLSALGVSIANVALPTLARTFSAPFQHVQWIILAYLLAVTIFIVSAGRLGALSAIGACSSPESCCSPLPLSFALWRLQYRR